MKLISLHFKNINSLAGEWKIDFTKPEFTDNGLFAITGKTGAGKSSILDVIVLALYGKTPRVEITGQNNEVMTRSKTDCYAEIVFEVEGKKWTASWKQEKTRSGTLKPVQRQIADSNNKIHADQVRGCDRKIIEILGLTFEQFTKVIMLAQGSFAAFLQAEKNDKGELLEQITGTEVYGEISKKVFERSKTEKEKLEKILVEIGAIKILSKEEIENLNHEIAESIKQKEQIDSDLQIIETAKKWLSDLENLQKQIKEAQQKLPNLEQNVQKAKLTLEQAEAVFSATKTEKENSDKVLVQVRELDTKIAEKEKSLTPVLHALNELEKIKSNLAQTFENHKKNLAETQEVLQQKQNWAVTNAKYNPLVEQFAAIRNQHTEVKQLLTDFNIKKSELEKAKEDLETKISIHKNALMFFAEKDKVLLEKEQELKMKKSDMSAILSGKDINTYQEEKENLTKFGIEIKHLIEVEKNISESEKEIEKLTALILSSENLETGLTTKISGNKTAAQTLKKQIDLLDENIKFSKTIQSLEEHRKSLEDGNPCPLCGSLEHPYSLGNEPKIGEKESELENLKKQEQQFVACIQQDEKALAKLIADRANAQTNKEKAEAQGVENSKKCQSILHEIKKIRSDFSLSDAENKIALLEHIREQKLKEHHLITAIISKATESEKLLKKLQDEEIPLWQEAKQIAEKAKIEAETNRMLSAQNLENRAKLLEESDKKYKEKNVQLLEIFTHYSVTSMEALEKCLKNWNENEATVKALKDQIIKLESALALANAEIENNQKQLAGKTAEKQGFEIEKQDLSTVRYNLFGDKRAEEEELRVKEFVTKAETAKTEAEKTKQDATTEHAKNHAIIAEKEKEAAEKQATSITEKSMEELQIEYDEKKPLSDLFSQKIGANRQSISLNDENLHKNHKKLKEKELQQETCTKWGSLNELIGSLDGKKYRNFAQALTFEHLISLSNHQLLKMSERYMLKRVGDATNPFELAVVDNFQNGEERSAQNLSGGEKFIVSLSLALGLANMASKNMKIDTLFIDEGFGTLDSDYLDVALSALSNLQNEGKLIGVISHLSELKERIAMHIEVIPLGNGYSRICFNSNRE